MTAVSNNWQMMKNSVYIQDFVKYHMKLKIIVQNKEKPMSYAVCT